MSVTCVPDVHIYIKKSNRESMISKFVSNHIISESMETVNDCLADCDQCTHWTSFLR